VTLVDVDRFPEFADFYAAYFHEDWRLDDATSDDVVRRYMSVDGQAAGQLLLELRLLTTTDPSDDDLEQALGPWTSFDPRSEGRRAREWIDHLILVLSQPLRADHDPA
jgi:hypothetical protein